MNGARALSSRGASTSAGSLACTAAGPRHSSNGAHRSRQVSMRISATSKTLQLSVRPAHSTGLSPSSHAAGWQLCRPSGPHAAQRRGGSVVMHAADAWQQPRPGAGNVAGDDSWRTLYDEPDTEDYLSLTEDEIQDRLLEAAGMISIILDVRPLTPRAFNPSLEVWRRVRKVPPWERHRLLQDLEPGAIRALWKASMTRYVLDDARAYDMARDYSIWQDFPESPGQVYTFLGRCEQYVLAEPQIRFFTEDAERQKAAGEAPWLQPLQDTAPIQSNRFKMLFFVQPGTGELFGRVVLPWIGPLDRWWLPCYLRMKMELTLTPLKSDAGADFTFEYPHPETEDLNGWIHETMLLESQLPNDRWPAPDLAESCGSPFSVGPRDYLRVAAPGLYVGCAYRSSGDGLYSEDQCVYFAIARKMSKEEYLRAAVEDGQPDGDDGSPAEAD